MARTNKFVFTLNNYDDSHCNWFEDSEIFKYVCFGREVGEGLTPHLQGYFEFENNSKKSIKACQSLIQQHGGPRMHIEVAKGSPKQAIDYCEKDGQFWEKGTRPMGQGKRTDLDQVASLVMKGASMSDVAHEFPAQVIKFSRGIEYLINLTCPRRKHKTVVWWLWGPAGSGKSKYAWETHPEAYAKNSAHKWWSGYTGQEVVIMDDFRPSKEIPFNFILTLFDRYPLQVETKGGTVEFTSQTIIVTSPYSPEQTLQNMEWIGTEETKQLTRRIEHVIQFPQLASFFSETS